LQVRLTSTDTKGDVGTISVPLEASSTGADEPAVLEELEVEELAVDGICGVY
jgi:mycofactocin precursor